MIGSNPPAPLNETETRALRLLLAGRIAELRDRTVLVHLRERGLVRLSPEGWEITLTGHLSYVQALFDAL
ncbi:hypothetical protein [Methylopila sp. Yamaguchi]|uniref:hypothetical protein n=1 Tax=Methylopila sp. Yamaguchi TaxID=1437817 RepID=UPI0011AF91A0|nr:hypothetical protein [Methylopila sp. Yamaguchi]